MSILIHAALTSAIAADTGVPSEIVYLPEGEHDITPTVDGKAKRITVRIPADQGATIAAKLQASLVQRQKQNVRPWFDFEHKSGKASAIPTAFRYVAGKGIMAAIEWTGAGKSAIEGRDFSYLSPTFLVDESGLPSGLPARGPLAALVNEPAFREIPRIAAAAAAEPSNSQPTHIMSKLIFAALAINAAAENAESEALRKIEAMGCETTAKQKRISELEAELADLKKDNDKMKLDAADATKARHTALVEAAVSAGKIAPKDDDCKSQFIAVLEAHEALGTCLLSELPVRFAALEKPLIHASGDQGKGDNESRVQAAQSKARQELGQDADFQLVWARAAELDPAAFN